MNNAGFSRNGNSPILSPFFGGQCLRSASPFPEAFAPEPQSPLGTAWPRAAFAARGPQSVKKASQSLPPAGGKGIKGSTAQFGKKSQTGFLPQFKVWKTKEYCMYFSFFKLKKWGKKTAETRRRNCAVLPKIIFCRGAPQGGLSCPFGAIHLLYLTENTTQAASLAPQRCAERNRRRRLLARSCAICTPKACKSCARQTQLRGAAFTGSGTDSGPLPRYRLCLPYR